MWQQHRSLTGHSIKMHLLTQIHDAPRPLQGHTGSFLVMNSLAANILEKKKEKKKKLFPSCFLIPPTTRRHKDLQGSGDRTLSACTCPRARQVGTIRWSLSNFRIPPRRFIQGRDDNSSDIQLQHNRNHLKGNYLQKDPTPGLFVLQVLHCDPSHK